MGADANDACGIGDAQCAAVARKEWITDHIAWARTSFVLLSCRVSERLRMSQVVAHEVILSKPNDNNARCVPVCRATHGSSTG